VRLTLLDIMLLGVCLLISLPGCGPTRSNGDDDDSVSGDDDSASGDDDSVSGDDDSVSDDDDTLGDDDSAPGDDDSAPGDDDSNPPGDDDFSPGDDDSLGNDDSAAGDDDSAGPTFFCGPGDDCLITYEYCNTVFGGAHPLPGTPPPHPSTSCEPIPSSCILPGSYPTCNCVLAALGIPSALATSCNDSTPGEMRITLAAP